ncbi:MAG: alpha/beta fold hydrolase [Acidobacteriaceae bacterium]|jgi:predicted alpha/beta-fold hydrolase
MTADSANPSSVADEPPRETAPPAPEPQPFIPTPFITRRFLSNPHLQTIFGNFLPRADHLPPPIEELVEVAPALGEQIASRVLCLCHWQPEPVRAARPTAILLHGLEGSAHSQYVVGNANKLWRAGANVIRMNMRNCGGPNYQMARETPTLYHSGLSSDVAAVMRHFLTRERLQSIALIGYSMGGNLVLKLAGELGPDAPPQLHSVTGVSPAIDLGPSSAALHRPINRLYEARFLRALFRRYRSKARFFPRAYDPNRLTGIRSLRDFDDRITAFYSGFASAEDYYYRAAAARVIDRIAVPTLILSALDDPFIRFTPATLAALHANPRITLLQPTHGGHCAFLARRNPPTPNPAIADSDDGYWAEITLLQFILAHAGSSQSRQLTAES